MSICIIEHKHKLHMKSRQRKPYADSGKPIVVVVVMSVTRMRLEANEKEKNEVHCARATVNICHRYKHFLGTQMCENEQRLLTKKINHENQRKK